MRGMKTALYILSCSLFLFSGCQTTQVMKVNNGEGLNPFITSDVDSARNLATISQTLNPNELATLKSSRYIKKYLTKKTPKAMVMASPPSCNYRYYWSNASSVSSAIAKAGAGCSKKILQYNELMNKSCQCNIAAINNTFFYPADRYIGELGYVPIIAEVNDKGDTYIIKGTAEWGKPGEGRQSFVLNTDKQKNVCKGFFDIKSKAKGELELNCFDGKYSGRGSFVNSGYNPELRFFNGTAKIDLSEGVVMRVIYGQDAM